MLRIVLIFIASFTFNLSVAQTVTGSWYGKADVLLAGNNSNYLTELVLKQKGNEVEGIFGYYFKDSYQSFFIRGTYNRNKREVSIKNLPMLFHGAETRNGIECPMNFEGVLMVSSLSSTLKGSFFTEPKYKYTCPELRVNLMMDASEKNQDSMLRNITAGKKFWAPTEDDYVISTVSPKAVDTLPLVSSTASVAKIPLPLSRETTDQLVKKFESRKNTYDKDVLIVSDSVLVTFYDNGDIDGDSISVFINKKPVLVNQRLSSRGLNIFVTLDTLIEINELSMFADNLGKFPPNTALMVISDGTNKKELYLSSSLTQNASVRLKRWRENSRR